MPSLARAHVVLGIALVGAGAACGLDIAGVGPPAGADASAPPPDAPRADAATPEASIDTPPPDAGEPCPDQMTRCGGTCVRTATDRAHCGGCDVACKATAACEGGCVAVADALAGFRYELPCVGAGSNPSTCAQPSPSPEKAAALTGTPGRRYDVRVRVRGLVEQRAYTNATSAGATGKNAAFFVTAPSQGSEAWNSYPLALSAPAVTYYLNAGESGHYYLDVLDYTATIRADAGATLKMRSQASDPNIVKNRDTNGDPIVVDGVPPAPNPFNGQFVQIDVDRVDPAP